MSERNCKICKASKSSGVTLYNAPKEEENREKWSTACGVTITQTSVVCQNHFSENDFYGRKRNLKVDALPTENLKEGDDEIATEAIQPHIKTEPPEFVVVTSSNSIALGAEASAISNVSIKEEPIDSFPSFAFIDENCFDEHTDNPIGTNEDGNNTTLLNELENKILTCGRLIMEIEKDGACCYKLICSYCKYKILTSDPNCCRKFITHFTESHDSKIKPLEKSKNAHCKKTSSDPTQICSEATIEEEKSEEATWPEELDTSKQHVKEKETCSKDGSDEDSTDETYEPKPKKSKKANNNTVTQTSDTNKKTEEFISFDHPDKNCVIALLELLKENSILWLSRQSIMKRFGEALTDVNTKFNERFPKYAVSKKQLRQSIDRIKDLYHRSLDDKPKRRTKTSVYKMKHPEYFELCAAIEENSKTIKKNCDLCQAIFYSPIDLQIHKVKIHKVGELPFKCQRCGYGFSCPKKFESHEQKHNRVKNFICEFCNRGFYSETKLQAHLTQHTDDSKLICEICGEKFPSLSKYRLHKLYHEAPKEKCEICGKLYFEKTKLANHMKSHRNERHYACDICGKKFNRRAGVTIHKRGVHKIKTQTFWFNKVMSTSDSEWASNNRCSIEDEAQNTDSNSSTISSTTNEPTATEIKPVITGNPNHTLFPLQILNSLLN